jgi:hypothetical protein
MASVLRLPERVVSLMRAATQWRGLAAALCPLVLSWAFGCPAGVPFSAVPEGDQNPTVSMTESTVCMAGFGFSRSPLESPQGISGCDFVRQVSPTPMEEDTWRWWALPCGQVHHRICRHRDRRLLLSRQVQHRREKASVRVLVSLHGD